MDYSDIGLQPNLIKYTSPLANMVDPESQIEDSSIRGIKITDKSVNLGKLYGQDLELGGASNISGRIRNYNTSMQETNRLDYLGFHAYDTSGNELIKIDSGGFYGYNTSGDKLVEVDDEGFHGYLTDGTKRIKISGTGIEGYGTEGNTFKFYNQEGGTLYGQIGYYSATGRMYVYSDGAPLFVAGSGQPVYLSAINHDMYVSSSGGRKTVIGATGVNAHIDIDSYDGSGGDYVNIDTSDFKMSGNSGIEGFVYLDVAQTKYIYFTHGIATGAISY